MKVKVIKTDYNYLEKELNSIGIENVLHIIPEHIFDGTLFVIIYKEKINNE